MMLRFLLSILLLALAPFNSDAQSDVYGQVYCKDVPARNDLLESPDSDAYMDYVSDNWDDSLGVDDYLWDHFFTIELYEAFPAFKGEYDIEYVVELDGSVTDVCFNQGINIQVDAIMYAVWEGMPKWIPAMKNGKKVATRQRYSQSYENQK